MTEQPHIHHHPPAGSRSRRGSLVALTLVGIWLFAGQVRAAEDVHFTTYGGNDWWIEVYVDAATLIREVDVSVKGRAWRPLALQEWGSWATSFYVEDGSHLRFRALSEDGQIATSSSYVWPSGGMSDPLDNPPGEDGSDPPQTVDEPGAFSAEFQHARGNDWWVEVEISSSASIAGVEVRINQSGWVPLARTAWASWASSSSVPGGSLVQMRAHTSDGRVALSPIYSWPDATLVGWPDDLPEGDRDDEEDDPSADEEGGEYAFDDERIAFLGRVDDRVSGQPACSWTGCGFILRTDATRVVMQVEATPLSSGNDYLRVQVQNGAEEVIELVHGRQSVTLATGPTDGPRTITIFKRTEPEVGTVRFLGLELDEGGLLEASSPAGPRLLAIGDSITAGYGNTGDGPHCGFTPATEDGYRTYANLVAQRFGGEAVINAFSGKGVYRNRGGGDPWTLPRLFDRLDVFDASSQADFVPVDAVVVNLGTNDFADSNPSEGPFVAAYEAFVADLRGRFPDAPILLATSPMLTDDWPEGLYQRSTLRAHLEDVIAAREAVGDYDVFLVDHQGQSLEGVLGCDYHPHVRTHERMADELADALSFHAGW